MIARAIVFIVGLGDLLAGAALLPTPRWFFGSVASFGTCTPTTAVTLELPLTLKPSAA